MQLIDMHRLPLVANPHPNWLADRRGDHFVALRLFAEACWARVGLHTQHHVPPVAVSWGERIQGRADLFEYCIEQRRRPLLMGFFELDETQLAELATLNELNPAQRMIRDEFLACSRRRHETRDLYGQPLPGDLFEICLAIEQAPPYHKQGQCSLVKRVRLNKQQYFAKLTDEVLSGNPPAGNNEFDEVTTQAALRALKPGIAPATTLHIIAADGQQCVLVAAVPKGYTYAHHNHRIAALYVDVDWLQWIVLAEWLFGLADRHSGNLIVQKDLRQAAIIDTAFGWRFHHTFLGWDEDYPCCDSFARAMWETYDPDLVFSRALLNEACEREGAVLATLVAFPHFPHRTGVQRQFALLRAALSRYPGDIRLGDIEQIA
jgi:hypothetical protein